MFLRKFFSSKNKLVWVLIDLLIVIIGVYCAFLIQSYAQRTRDVKDQTRVLSALKYELEAFRFIMARNARSAQVRYEQLQVIQANGSYSNFSDYRFIEPQYDYQAMEYALGLQNTAIVDFELSEALQNLWVRIKRVEHVERMLTETAANYRSLPAGMKPTSEAYQLIWAENRDHFNRFVIFIQDRGSISQLVSVASVDALAIINGRLGAEKTRELEREIILKNIRLVTDSEDEAVQVGKVYYEHIPEEEIREFYRLAEEPE